MSETSGLVFLKDMEKENRQPGWFSLYGKPVLLLLFTALFVVAVVFISRGALSYRSAGREYDRLRTAYVRTLENIYESDPAVQETEGTEKTVYPKRPVGAVLDIDFEALQNINPDVVAWLHVPALNISYPVVYASDRDYYTTHTFEGNVNANGAIFAEPFNAPGMTDINTFLYGHDAADGSMFGKLHELSYLDAERERDPYLYLYCKDGDIRKYFIYSYYVTKEDSESFRTIDEADYTDYVNLTKRLAQTKIQADFTGSPDLLTLSTCYGASGTKDRFLAHGVRVAR